MCRNDMNKEIKKICCAFGILITALFLTSAHADVFEDTFRDFTSCDASVFRTLHREAATWKTVVPLESIGDYSWIKVKNRLEDRDNHIDFTNSPTVAGLKLLSFIDETTDLDSMGLYYYWGFTVSGTVENVVQKLKPLIHNSERLRNDGGAFVRTEIKLPGSRWLPAVTNANTASGVYKVERVLLIEPDEGHKNVVRVSCSLQGGVTADLLKEVRPDIDPKEYPKQIRFDIDPKDLQKQASPTVFDDTQIPESVAKVARETTWTPKFKKLSYTYNTKLNDTTSTYDSRVTVEMEAQEQLVKVKEMYGTFTVQRLMAGMAQLKSRSTGTGWHDGRVHLTTDLKMSVPAMFGKGTKLSVFWDVTPQPQKRVDEETQVSISCEVIDEIRAETVFPTLTGRAFKMACTYGKKLDITTKVFLEDLGITVELDSKSDYGRWTNNFLQFTIER